MSAPHLVYFADPMCSWCWGFAPVVGAIRERFGERLPVRLVMGGLRPGTTKPMDAAAKATIRQHWEHVRDASGQPFDFAFFDREGFVYDSDPAARAVAVARRHGMDAAFAMMARVQHAFYAENRDVTREDALADLAEASGIDRGIFLDAFATEEAKKETWRDYGITQQAGIGGFPTLIANDGRSREYVAVTRGFQPGERILPVLEHWFAALPVPESPAG